MASPDAAGLAAENGYTSVHVFRGGLPEWIQAGYETVSVEKLPKVDIPTISIADLEKLLASGDDFILLDIRPDVEAAKIWIESGKRRHVSFDEIDARFGDIPKGKKIVILDVNAKRAPLAGRYLNLKGFAEIMRLDGGMNAWVAAGKPFKKGN